MSKPVKLLACALSVALAAGLLPASAGIALAEERVEHSDTDELTLAAYNELSDDEADGIIVVMEDGSLSLLSLFGESTEEQLANVGLEVTNEVKDATGAKLLAVQPTDGQPLGEAVRAAESVEGVAFAQPNYLLDFIEPLAEGDGSTEDPATPADPSEDADGSTEGTVEGETPGTEDTAPAPIETPSGTNDPISHNTAAAADRTSERDQYWLYAADLADAWDLGKTNKNVTVAVIDSGAMLAHEDLSDVILADLAYDATTKTRLVASASNNGGDNRADGHGTHVAGIIGATANNGVGIAGSSYNANVLPINVVKAGTNSGSLLAVLEAYNYVVNLVESGKCNVRVVNLSLGSYKESANFLLLKDSIEYARSEYGIATVCAGGNNGSSEFMYPGDYEACISVTALDVDGTDWRLSDQNLQKDIAAPGRYICSTVPYTEDLALTAVEETAGLLTEASDNTLEDGDASDGNTPNDEGTTPEEDAPSEGGEDATEPEPEPEPDMSYLERYGYLSGSSMASPIVAGTLALMFSIVPTATVDEAVEALTATATDIPAFTDESGVAGALNAEAAILYLIEHHQISFTDVEEDAWYYDAIMFVAEAGIMTGYDDGSGQFDPEGHLTREMAARLFYNYLGNGDICEETTHVDVRQDEWYSEAVNWAVATGVMTGYDDGLNRFGIGKDLTREEAAKVIATIAEADVENADDTKFHALVGWEDTDDWAVSYMIWAVDMGVINGTDDTNELLPTKHVTRAEMAKMIMNCIEAGIL